METFGTMIHNLSIKTMNTILYCKHWEQTVAFYQTQFGLAINFRNEWFVEFQLTDSARISIADEKRATIKTSRGAGITLALQVDNIEETWQYLQAHGVAPGPIKIHAWGARVFYCVDPEGHRIEVWMNQRESDDSQEE